MYSKDRTTIVDRREMLKVKVKSLACEAKIIRKEEKRSCGPLREELYLHRVNVVRREARHAHLAYGFIRGRTIEQMECKKSPPYDKAKVEKMIKKYGPPVVFSAPTTSSARVGGVVVEVATA